MTEIIKTSDKRTIGEILYGLDEKEIKLIKEICNVFEEKEISYRSINKALHLADKVLYTKLINRVS